MLEPLAGNHLFNPGRAEGDEAQAMVPVSGEGPANRPVAEAAIAVKDYQRSTAGMSRFPHTTGMLRGPDTIHRPGIDATAFYTGRR